MADLMIDSDLHPYLSRFLHSSPDKNQKFEVPPRFELGSLDSESRVLTITPRDLVGKRVNLTHEIENKLLRGNIKRKKINKK